MLQNGVGLGDLEDYRQELVDAATEMQRLLNDREVARGFIDIYKQLLLGRLNEFNRKVRGILGQSPFVRALPKVPSFSDGESKILALPRR